MEEQDKDSLEDLGAIIAGLFMGAGLVVLIWGWIHYT